MALRFVLLCAGLSLVLAVPHRQKRFLTDTGTRLKHFSITWISTVRNNLYGMSIPVLRKRLLVNALLFKFLGVTGNCLVGHQNCHHCGTYTMISGEYLCCAECDDSIMTSPSGTGGIHCQCTSNSPPTDFSPEHWKMAGFYFLFK